MNYPHPIIAKEGWPFLAVLFFMVIFSGFYGPLWLVGLLVVLFVFVLQFFRDPPRVIPSNSNAVVSPADGRIVVVEKTFDAYANREALKISVFMNVFNVHSNRSCVNGKILDAKYFPGKFFNADLDKASLENERNALVIETTDGAKVTLVQVAGLVARRILCYVKPGDLLSKGQRYGFIRFGSRVDVYLPLDAMPKVVIGEKVQASSTILAELSQ